MKLQQLMSYTRRAIDDYNMIQDGDRMLSVYRAERTV